MPFLKNILEAGDAERKMKGMDRSIHQAFRNINVTSTSLAPVLVTLAGFFCQNDRVRL